MNPHLRRSYIHRASGTPFQVVGGGDAVFRDVSTFADEVDSGAYRDAVLAEQRRDKEARQSAKEARIRARREALARALAEKPAKAAGAPALPDDKIEAMRALRREGATLSRVAYEFDVCIPTAQKYTKGLKPRAVKMERGKVGRPVARASRNRAIVALLGNGNSYADVGEIYGLTPSRIRQIFKAHQGAHTHDDDAS